MTTRNPISAILFGACLMVFGNAHAIVGTIAVGLGQMNDEIGDIKSSFSADAIVETEDMKATGKVYYKPGKVRDEMNMSGQQMVIIRLMDENRVLMLMGNGMYMETTADQNSEQAPEYELVSREIVGPETVNGMATIKYKSVYQGPDGKMGGFTWFNEDNVAVKGFLVSESKGEKDRIKYEFTSYTRGDQSEELFQVPPGSQKFDMGAFAGMQGMGSQGTGQGGTGSYGSSPSMPPQQPQASEPAGAAEEEQDPGFVGEVAEETQNTVEEETKRGINDAVRKGLGGLFGR